MQSSPIKKGGGGRAPLVNGQKIKTTKQIKGGSGINAEWTRGGRGGFRRLNL
jgi:hypothetical protein